MINELLGDDYTALYMMCYVYYIIIFIQGEDGRSTHF